MNDHNDSVMIALLPITTDWCHIELPHMTLVYAGKFQNLSKNTLNELLKDTSSLAYMSGVVHSRVTGVEVFGDDSERVDVLTLELTPHLAAMRRFVERWNASEHKTFRPHATIGPAGQTYPYFEVPTMLAFDRIMVGWGNEQFNFWLNK